MKQQKTIKSQLLFEIPQWQKENYSLDCAVACKENKQWKKYSTDELIEKANQVSRGLLAKGIKKGENIGLISFNRPEWNFLDIGIQQIAAINVPMYPNMSKKEYLYILKESGIKTLFVEDEELFKKIDSMKEDIDQLQNIYTFDKVENAPHWEEIIAASEDADQEEVEKISSKIEEDDLATIVYTSGTTGDPKGVMLSHKNIMSNIKASQPLLPIDKASRTLSFLPLNHIFERMLNYVYMASGVSIYYAEDLDSIGNNIKEVKPHIFSTVPRLLEKIYEKIVAKGRKQNAVKRALFFGALNLANEYELSGKSVAYNWMLKLANQLVFSKWREALGGEVKLIVAGGAALNPKLARIFTAAELPVLEGYGLTETSPVIAVNRWEIENRKFGTVGKPLENVKVKIADDGEVLCKGPNVMQGYYKKKDKTDEVIDKEGWFYTEDVGKMDSDGFLSITDRKDSVFKTSGGKKVAPQPIENQLKESALIDQVMVIGEGRKMVTALIRPDFETLKEWCEEKNITCSSDEKAIEEDKVVAEFEKIVDEKNEKFSQTEKIKKFELVAEEWTVDGGELTPTQKVKRPVIRNKYEKLINEMYKE